MKIELEIKEILNGQYSAEGKANKIRKLMNWDKKKLIAAITQHGTTTNEQQNLIINKFWGSLSKGRHTQNE